MYPRNHVNLMPIVGNKIFHLVFLSYHMRTKQWIRASESKPHLFISILSYGNLNGHVIQHATRESESTAV